MCGYFATTRILHDVSDIFDDLHLPGTPPIEKGYQRRFVDGLACHHQGSVQIGPALWWFALKPEAGTFTPNEKLTSFNARDLSKPLWRGALKNQRGIIFATELGESEGKNRYLMQSKKGFALGCVYKNWTGADGQLTRSFAVITRDPHQRFSKYHSKSFPLFLPLDSDLLKDWLNPDIETTPQIEQLLNEPKLTVDLEVTRVKTYKNGEALADSEILEKD